MSPADGLVVTVAGLLGLWALLGAATLHPFILRWRVAQGIQQRFGNLGARIFLLLIAVAMLSIALRLAMVHS